jgi:hypothetical protein
VVGTPTILLVHSNGIIRDELVGVLAPERADALLRDLSDGRLTPQSEIYAIETRARAARIYAPRPVPIRVTRRIKTIGVSSMRQPFAW